MRSISASEICKTKGNKKIRRQFLKKLTSKCKRNGYKKKKKPRKMQKTLDAGTEEEPELQGLKSQLSI